MTFSITTLNIMTPAKAKLSVIYAECRYAVCPYAVCPYAECPYAECFYSE